MGLGTEAHMSDLCQLLPGFSLTGEDVMTERVAIPTLGPDIALSMQEPQPVLPPWHAPPPDAVLGRRRLLVVAATTPPPSSSSLARLAPCAVGWYNPGVGKCLECPPGMSTRGVGSTRREQCECVSGYYNRSTSCVPCPVDTFRSVTMSPYVCAPCLPGMETTFGQAGQAACACVPGLQRMAAGVCTPCPAGMFCTPCWRTSMTACPASGVWVTPCMPGGTSPPGSTSLLNCTCTSGQARLLRAGGTLNADPPDNFALYCMPIPPHAVYNAAKMQIECPPGWNATLIKGRPILTGCVLCGVGRYLQRPTNSCVPCPLGNYTDRVDAVDGCTSCGPGLTTLAVGASNATACTCPVGTRRDAVTRACLGCSLTQYALVATGGCAACPPLMRSVVGARSIDDCMCGPGYMMMMTRGAACVLCPTGTFSKTAGKSPCTPCHDGTTTIGMGHTSVADCVCKPGWNATAIPGVCRAAQLLATK
jgi:hypothetical protein